MKLNENQKITLTIGQLKRLIRESDDSVIRELEKDINFCKDALNSPNGKAAADARTNYGKDWKKQTKIDLKNAMAKLKKLDPDHRLLKEASDEDHFTVVDEELGMQARNCLDLFAGNPPSTILRALKQLSPRVVAELKEYFSTDNLEELAQKIASRR